MAPHLSATLPLPPSLPPAEEARRLAALRAADILDTPAEPEFDVLTRFAAELCGAPIALVSLVDDHRQWFKARVGLETRETPREVAFCAHALGRPDLLEVEDAAADPRFADNPLVTGDPHVRFYAGAPLRTADGHALGTICVLDRVPRRLTDAQRASLDVLARQVMTQIALRRPASAPPPPAAAATVVQRPDRAPPSAHPPRFGRFRTLGVVGEGAMATVFIAYDEALRRRVAVKLVHPTDDPDEQVRVHREALALARISHPNVVQVFEVGFVGDQTFIAMEFVQGVTLTLWQSARRRPLPALLAMYVQAGRGLVAAHAVGVVHRDFKPDNVLVGADGRPRVADFGLARFHGCDDLPPAAPDGGERGVVETAAGTLVGTPAYMSPEQYRSARVDDRADQFSFCAALYEALYGVRPFAGASLAEIRDRIAAGDLARPPADRVVAPALHAALLRGLARDPAARWPSLAALVDHLERYDPARDTAAAAAERHAFAVLLTALMLAVGAVMLALALAIPGFYTPVSLIAPVVVVLVVLGVTLRRLRARLLGNHFHRLMVDMILTCGFAVLVGRVLGVLAGASAAHALMLGMLAAAAATATLAVFVARFMAAIAGVQLACAALIAAGLGPLAVVDVVAQTSAALLFVRAWDRSATGRYLRLADPADERLPT